MSLIFRENIFCYLKVQLTFFFFFQVIKESLAAYLVTERAKWVTDWPGQAVLCASQKYWTTYVHESIRKGKEVNIK